MSDFSQKLSEIAKDLEFLSHGNIRDLPSDEIKAVWTQITLIKSIISQAQDTLLPFMIASVTVQNQKPIEEADRCLTALEASDLLKVTPEWLYKHPRLPFRIKLSGKTLRYSQNGIKKWMARKGSIS